MGVEWDGSRNREGVDRRGLCVGGRVGNGPVPPGTGFRGTTVGGQHNVRVEKHDVDHVAGRQASHDVPEEFFAEDGRLVT